MQTFYSIPPQVYEDQFWWKKDDVEFWKRELNQDNVKILEFKYDIFFSSERGL